MSVAALFQMMEDRSNTKRALQVAERSFHPLQHHVQSPQFLGIEVSAIGLENVNAVEDLGLSQLLLIDAPAQLKLSLLPLDIDEEESRGPLVALPQPSDSAQRFFARELA